MLETILQLPCSRTRRQSQPAQTQLPLEMPCCSSERLDIGHSGLGHPRETPRFDASSTKLAPLHTAEFGTSLLTVLAVVNAMEERQLQRHEELVGMLRGAERASRTLRSESKEQTVPAEDSCNS